MTHVVVIANAEDDFGAGLCREFSRKGWTVFGGTETGAATPDWTAIAVDPRSIESMRAAASTVTDAVNHVDILVWNSAKARERANSLGALDFDAMKRDYDIEGLGPIRFVEAFLPLTAGGMKRICFITDRGASIEAGPASPDHLGQRMAMSTVPMAAAIMSNDLGAAGYGIGLCIPSSAEAVFEQLTASHAVDARSVIRGDDGKIWPF